MIALADGHVAHQGDVALQLRLPADADLGPDNAEGADLDVVVDFRAGVDRNILGNAGRHRRCSLF